MLLGAVLALSSADNATVGASATQLRHALHIGNTDIGLLVAVTSVVAAVASVPFGVLADRIRRTRTLGAAVLLWGVAMLWSATATSFGRLLLARMLLGVVIAAAGPVVASMVGDYFVAGERGRIYGYILTGELLGAGIGFAVTGDIAALSWRAAFVILAVPTFVLAWYIFHMPEPVRGGRHPLVADGATAVAAAAGGAPGTPAGAQGDDLAHGQTDAQRLAAEKGIVPEEDRVLRADLRQMGIIDAARAVLRIRTNVILIVASACGYFYLSGIETFGMEFVKEQYRIPQAVASLLLLVLGGGAVVGVLAAGGLSDRFLRRGFLNSRIVVTALAAIACTLLFVPALLTRSVTTALPYMTVAAFMLSAQNPPIDAARLDIVPSLLWGRAEGIRTALRTGAQSLAPVLFGVMSEYAFGGGRAGLQWTFVVMLAPLAANGLILLRAMHSYPRDVATAAAAAVPLRRPHPGPVPERPGWGGAPPTGGLPPGGPPPAWPPPAWPEPAG